jgi:hypothetical protein
MYELMEGQKKERTKIAPFSRLGDDNLQEEVEIVMAWFDSKSGNLEHQKFSPCLVAFIYYVI